MEIDVGRAQIAELERRMCCQYRICAIYRGATKSRRRATQLTGPRARKVAKRLELGGQGGGRRGIGQDLCRGRFRTDKREIRLIGDEEKFVIQYEDPRVAATTNEMIRIDAEGDAVVGECTAAVVGFASTKLIH